MTNIKYLTASIESTATSYTFTDSSINDDCSIKLVTAPPTIKITGATQTGNSCTVTFESGVEFGLRAEVSNIEEFKVDAAGDDDDAMPSTAEVAPLEDLNALANDVTEGFEDIYSEIGDIEELVPESSNLVDAINECFQSVSSGKVLIADAITDKGVETSATDSFQTMATNISNISGGGGFAECKLYSHIPLSSATDTYTCPKSGTLYVQSCGYMNGQADLKKNGAAVSPSTQFSQGMDYAYHRQWHFSVNEGDVITIYTYSSGNSCSMTMICLIQEV